MKITLSLFLLLTSYLSYSQTYIHGTPYVEVTGEGKMEVVPDKIVLGINVSEYQKSKETLEDRELKMRTALEELGINTKEALGILDFSSDYSYWNRRDIKMTKQYSLTLTDPDVVSDVYVKLEEIGISSISLLEVTHSQMSVYEQQVKLDAIKSAKYKADGMLAQLDQKVGKTLFIQEKGKFLPSEYFVDQSSYYRAQMNATGAISRGVSGPEYYLPELSFRKIELAYNILVRFEIL
jgi:uncharacterized protein YggE